MADSHVQQDSGSGNATSTREIEALLYLVEESVPAPGLEYNQLAGAGFSLFKGLLKLALCVKPVESLKASAELLVELVEIAAGQSQREPPPYDQRFAHPAWQQHGFKKLYQSYLAWSDAVTRVVDVDSYQNWRERERVKMLLEILTSSAAPTNFFASNPAAIDQAINSGGKTLLKGTENMLRDLREGRKIPRHLNPEQFDVGRNLAATPGTVVFRNQVLELIQYRPATATVLVEPTLLITPQINKYYFMDLAPGRSFAEYAVSRGIPTFMVSWKNPGIAEGDWNLDTYVAACLEALDAVCDITGSPTANIVGICAGGMTATAVLNTLAARGDKRVSAIAYAVTVLDFDVPSPLGAFNSSSILNMSSKSSHKKGMLAGRDLGTVFSWMRPNDLVWRYWVNNYLLGNDPPPFDILYWNDDSTNLPNALHQQFLQIFEHNALCQAGGLVVLGHPVDLSTIEIDTFVIGAEKDHLTPWTGCYRTTQLLRGNSTYVLSNAGHIAGLVNPPTNPKARYLIGPADQPDPQQWKLNAREEQGTWWQAWADWLHGRLPTERRAPKKLGSKRYPVLDQAPGTYVKLVPSG